MELSVKKDRAGQSPSTEYLVAKLGKSRRFKAIFKVMFVCHGNPINRSAYL